MQLLTAHKILISSAIVMFTIYGAVELRHFLRDDPTAWIHVAFASLAIIGLSLYLRWVWIHRPGHRDSTRSAG